MLNREGYRDQNGKKLAEDGIWGTKTEYAWKKFQQDADKKAASSQSKGGQLLQKKNTGGCGGYLE